MKKSSIELGTITDLSSRSWVVYTSEPVILDSALEEIKSCESLTLQRETESGEEECMEIYCASLADIPNYFSQRQVNALENFIISEAQDALKSYNEELYCDLQRGNE